MKTLVDTSSLVRMAQDYSPFDTKGALNTFLEGRLGEGSLILLDRVMDEVKLVSRGAAYEAFPCLRRKECVCRTDGLTPPAPEKFYHMLDNNFVNSSVKRLKLKGDEIAYRSERNAFLQGADCMLVVKALNERNIYGWSNVQILTEESRLNNDGKLFKKIPSICEQLGITTISTVEYLRQCSEEIAVEVRLVQG